MCSAGLQFFIIAGEVGYEKGVCRLAGINLVHLHDHSWYAYIKKQSFTVSSFLKH